MSRLDQTFLRQMLQALEDGGRFALSPDRFAEIFPPGHHDDSARAQALRFATAHRCMMDYWPQTNEVFFTKLPRGDA